MTTLSEIKVVVEKINSDYQKRVIELFSDLDIKPTVDVNGRYHAPIDGYVWIDNNIYLGGQYLPFDEENNAQTYTLKIKINTKLKEQFDAIFGYNEIGKVWEKDGISIAYYYAQVNKTIYNALLKLLPADGRKIVLVSEKGSNNSKTWIFKTSKFTRRCASLWGSDWHELFEGLSWEFAPGVEFEIIKKKDGKYTFKSKFDNQEVRYEYADTLILG